MLRFLPSSAAQVGRRTPPRRLALPCWVLAVGLLISACAPPPAPPSPHGLLRPPSAVAGAVAPGLTAVPGPLPFPIEQNVGQAGSSVGYLLRAGAMKVGFGAGELTFVLDGSSTLASPGSAGWRQNHHAHSFFDTPAPRWTVRQELVGASKAMPSGTVESPTTVSYFKGGPEQWLVGVPTFQQVAYTDAWPGITVTYERGSVGPKSAYHVSAGADPGQIRVLYSGARVRVDEVGVLVAETPLGVLRESPPVAWQERDGTRVMVDARYKLLGESSLDDAEYGFALGAYDADLPLVIDPQIAYTSYVGGSGTDWSRAIAVDGAGNAYLTGHVDNGATFPGSPATFDNSPNGDWDAFIVKMNPAGTALLYAGFIGGTGQEIGFGITVDGAGSAYIAGLIGSSGTSFPDGDGMGALATFDGTYNGGEDAFVAKVNPTGTALLYAGYIGGSGPETASGIAVDGAGNAYVAGLTGSSETTFPDGDGMGALTTLDGTYNGGGGDAYVVKINSAGTALLYASYIGGDGYDQAYAIAVDGAGTAYLAGRAESSSATFPTGAGMGGLTTFDGTSNGGGGDAFVVKVNPAGTALQYAGFIGGNAYDFAYGIAIDAAGNAYVVGSAESSQATFPNGSGMGSLTSFDKTFNGTTDAFVAKVNPTGTALLYVGYIGGGGIDVAVGIAVDAAGNAYIAGGTTSSETTFPDGDGMGTLATFDGTYNAVTSAFGDAFVAKVNPTGTALLYAGYLGGDGQDTSPPYSTEVSTGIAVDAAGNAYVTGRTNSSEATFPDGLGMTGLPTFDSTYGGGLADAFVVKVTPGATCALAGRPAAAGLTYANAAWQYAYYDYITYGTTNSYYALVYEYQAYLSSQAGATAHASGNYATAKTNFNAAATYAYYGHQYAYASYLASSSPYANFAYAYGYYVVAYENQAYVSC